MKFKITILYLLMVFCTLYSDDDVFKPEALIPNSTIQITDKRKEYSFSDSYLYKLSNGQEINEQSLKNLREFDTYYHIVGLEEILLNFDIDKDEFENRYFIEPKIDKSTYIKFYIGLNNKKTWLRFKLQYSSDDWLFINYFKVSADNFKWESPVINFERDNNSKVWEWIDISATQKYINLGNNIAKSKKAMIRFYGTQYYSGFEVSEREKQAIIDTLHLYNLLNSKMSKKVKK